jgi:hypothetical protein
VLPAFTSARHIGNQKALGHSAAKPTTKGEKGTTKYTKYAKEEITGEFEPRIARSKKVLSEFNS